MRRIQGVELKKLLKKAYDECFPYLLPIRLDISLTTACNTKCAYCWHQEKAGSDLTCSNLSGLVDLLCVLKPPKLCLTGGEPTIWPGFEELVSYAHNAGINKIWLCTNGYRLRELGFYEKIVKLGVNLINISVDTLNDKKFEMLRGFKFTYFKEVISNSLWIKRKYPNVAITLASVMSKEVTPQDLFELKKFCSRLRFGHFVQTFDETGFSEIDKRFCLNDKERKKYNSKLFWFGKKSSMAVKRIVSPFTKVNTDLRCLKGFTTVKLLSDGSVRFCWNGSTIGNIFKDSFIDIWNSNTAFQERVNIKQGLCKCKFDCDVYESLELYENA
ncbi:MAG: radical SAM protein [Candidatus Omnitrophota bacterium]